MAKLTDKQKIFANEYLVDLNATRAYKTWNFKLVENPLDVIIDSLAILLGEYNIYRKKAALLILRILLRSDFLKGLLENKELYPISRNDNRVKLWSKKILEIGYCEKCRSDKNLEAHHIIEWSEYPQGRIDLKNGMCLCLSCHTEEHKEDKSYYLMRGKLNAKVNT